MVVPVPPRVVRRSKRLSYVLRHAPQSVGVELDEGGWVDVDTLLSALAAHGEPMSRDDLHEVVATNDKQRLEWDRGTDRVRARQGHSLPVELGLAPTPPPAVLFHGTPERNLASVLAGGLQRRGRHAVHLSPDAATAQQVGARRGRPVVLRVDASAMAGDGHVFTVTGNGVWLVDEVPARYLEVLDEPPPIRGG